jgi:hypothetical protein
MNATTFTLTPDQQNAYNLLTTFLGNPAQREFILLGSAGTGKTALITKFIRDNKNLRMVISAPTHQALGVAKSKLLGDGNMKLKTVSMQTIQSLLGYTQYYNKDGSKFFAKGKHPKSWKDIDIVLVDECSMLTNQIIDDIRDRCNKQNTKHIKVIYIGDPAQLPPVNQPPSKLFVENNSGNPTGNKIELTQIVRTNNNNIIGLSQTHRNWIFSEDIRKNVPKLKEHLCTNIQMFNFRTEVTKWLDTFVEKTKSQVGNANIILAWTNSAVDAHNDYVRNKLFNKENLQKYEDGEIVIFIDYFRIKLPTPAIEENANTPTEDGLLRSQPAVDVEAKGKKTKDNFISFHASEQVRVVSSVLSNQRLPFFKPYKSDSLDIREMKMNKEFEKLIDLLNTTICDKEYKIYTINITKINNPSPNSGVASLTPETFVINTFKDKWDAKQLFNEFENAIRTTTDTIYEFIKKEQCDAPTKAKLFEYMEKKINGIRKYWDENIIGHIATIGYGYAITVHKSQGTTFGDVFIDVFDICQNTDRVEMAKCLYTSFTRASGELFILG